MNTDGSSLKIANWPELSNEQFIEFYNEIKKNKVFRTLKKNKRRKY